MVLLKGLLVVHTEQKLPVNNKNLLNNMTDLSKNIQALREKKAVVEMGGGEAAIEKQIAMGKLTARDRILS